MTRVVAIVVIGALEVMAILNGMNGIMFATTLALIAFIAGVELERVREAL